MGFVSEKGGNCVTTGWCRDWSEAVVVLAGQEGKGEPARGRSPRRGEEVEPTLTRFCAEFFRAEWQNDGYAH